LLIIHKLLSSCRLFCTATI